MRCGCGRDLQEAETVEDDTLDKPVSEKWERNCLACGRAAGVGYSCTLVFVTRAPIEGQSSVTDTVRIAERNFEYRHPLFVKPHLCLPCLRRLHLKETRVVAIFGILLILGALFVVAAASANHPILKYFIEVSTICGAIPLGLIGRHELEELLVTFRGGARFAHHVERIAQVHPQDPWDHWLIKNLHRQARKIGKHYGRTDCFVARLWTQNVGFRGARPVPGPADPQ